MCQVSLSCIWWLTALASPGALLSIISLVSVEDNFPYQILYIALISQVIKICQMIIFLYCSSLI
jgi:hypothetical protein